MNDQRRVGRQRKSGALTCVLSFSASAEEADLIYQKARQKGLSLSSFLRVRLGLRQGSATTNAKTTED